MMLTYEEQLEKKINAAYKRNNQDEADYYSECLANCCACASYETFISSWAGKNWLKRRHNEN